MKINIASFGGRAHLLDLARELEKLGHDVKFYSYVPTKRAISFGLTERSSCSLYYYAIPFLILFKIFGFRRNLLYFYRIIYDWIVAFKMSSCDVFIGQVPMHYHSMKMAKKRFNAITICESGLSNIDKYISILKSIGAKDYPRLDVSRYRKCYNVADYIAVASVFSKKGFIENGYNEKKVFMNPYGVSVENFRPTELASDAYDCIVVGQWCKRKGSDMVSAVCKRYGYRLLHVGSIVDIDFPQEPNFTHVDAVPESQLVNYYSKAKVFLFPSYEDGFGLVLIQAAACGLPIVCSPNTGGPTLRDMLSDKKWIVIMNSVSEEELNLGILKALELSNSQKGERNYVDNDLQQLTWKSYGERYGQFLKELVSKE